MILSMQDEDGIVYSDVSHIPSPFHTQNHAFSSSSHANLTGESLRRVVLANRCFTFNPTDLLSLHRRLQEIKERADNRVSVVQVKSKHIREDIAEARDLGRSMELDLEGMKLLSSDVTNASTVNYEGISRTKEDVQSLICECTELASTYEERSFEVEHVRRLISGSLWNIRLKGFANMLGLTISLDGNTTRIYFAPISLSGINKEAHVTLRITGDKIQGVSCFPVNEEFDVLMEHLNCGLNFGRFICLVREAFKNQS